MRTLVWEVSQRLSTLFAQGFFVANASFHLCNSEWPSANEKELELLWLFAGMSPRLVMSGTQRRKPSFKELGFSSTITNMSELLTRALAKSAVLLKIL